MTNNLDKSYNWKNWIIKKLLSNESTKEEILNFIANEENKDELKDINDNNEKNLIKNILNLNEKSVEDIMVPRSEVVAVEHNKTYSEILDLIKDESHSRMPVYKKNLDNVVGFFHIKDFIKSNKEEFKINTILREILYVAPKSPILDLLKTMRSSKIHIGLVVDGVGGVDGLIHITDLSWSRINHPSEILELDQKLNVVILDFDDNKSRIQLGLKQLSAHPWDKISEDLKEGDRVKGKVVVIADYGAFIEIEEGVEGLVHVSEMSWSTHLRSAQDFVNVGDEVEAIVLTLDRESRKMSLGIKQITPDPWTDITSKYPIGSKHTGIVRNFTNFGVFIELEEGIDGLVYISDLSWTKKVKHPSEVLTLGDKIDVIVLELDVDGRKLSLGHKHTKDNPWDKYENEYAVNTEHKTSLSEIVDKGATIRFNDDIIAFVPSRHMEKQDGSKLVKGEEADFKIIEFNKEFKRVVASHTIMFKEQETKNVKRASKKMETLNKEKTTLGDLDALANLKEKMEDDN